MWQERRLATRHVMELPVKYRIVDKTDGRRFMTSAVCKTKNVCDAGVLFLAAENFKNGTLLEITFPVKDQIFTMKGKVAHCEKDPDQDLYQVGIHFPNADHIFKIKMAEQVHLITQYQQTMSKEKGRIVTEEEAAHRWIEEHSRSFAKFF